jgi:DNA-nicking Smr family endonuclease
MLYMGERNVDFGNILDAWERQNARPAGKQARKQVEGARGTGIFSPDYNPIDQKQVDQKQVDPLTAWLRINGVYDKDAEYEEAAEEPGKRRRRLLNKKPDGIIDLHGLTRDDAWAALEAFFNRSRLRGFEKILVVHGKGNHSGGEAVLKRTAREFIERCPFAGESGHGDAASGGSGVTWVFLRDN